MSAVHVKQGFTTSYINLTSSDEYGSAISKAAQLQPSKIWNSLKDILVKISTHCRGPNTRIRSNRSTFVIIAGL